MKNVENRRQIGSDLHHRLLQLDYLLKQSEALWRPQPYKQVRPDWCEGLPELCEKLLALSDESVASCMADSQALFNLLKSDIPALSALQSLVSLPVCEREVLDDLGPHFNAGIPGRKWQQIEHFAAAVGRVEIPLLEWCGGKGHLGRYLGAQWQVPVSTVEHDEALCEEGGRLAEKAGIEQRFFRVDALSAEGNDRVGGHHAVALHACGELHRTLLRSAIEKGLAAFDIVPCCYYIGAGESYRPFHPDLTLQLQRDDLRLAVTETVTAAGREVVLRDQEMAWKLGFEQLRRELSTDNEYRPLKPINKKWLRLEYEAFCEELAEREGVTLPSGIDWSASEEMGWQRQREVMRLSLVRAAFRRAIEMWLVLDMAAYIEEQGYEVSLSTFCDRDLTPRNILLSARRRND